MVEQHSENITRFANTYLIQQEPPRSVLEFTLEDMKNFLALPENKASRVSFKRFIRFLDETTRIKFDKARELTDFLKSI